MKKLLLLVVGIASAFAMQSFSELPECKVEAQSYSLVETKGNVVYVSTGGYGKRYHSSSSCRGLRNANGVAKMDKQRARESGLTPCRICY